MKAVPPTRAAPVPVSSPGRISPARLREIAAVFRGHVWLAGDMARFAAEIDAAALSIEQDADVREVRLFAGLMSIRMIQKSREGRGGWTNLPASHLWAMLREAVEKGDPIDIANYAMMIQHNTQTRIAEAAAPARGVMPDGEQAIAARAVPDGARMLQEGALAERLIANGQKGATDGNA